MTITIDKLGRMVLPKPFRDQFQIHPGDSLNAEVLNGSIVISPIQEGAGLIRKKGILVHHGSEVIDFDLQSFMESRRNQHLVEHVKGV